LLAETFIALKTPQLDEILIIHF